MEIDYVNYSLQISPTKLSFIQWNISTSTIWINTQSGTYIHGYKMMHPSTFVDIVTFDLASQLFCHFLSSKNNSKRMFRTICNYSHQLAAVHQTPEIPIQFSPHGLWGQMLHSIEPNPDPDPDPMPISWCQVTESNLSGPL